MMNSCRSAGVVLSGIIALLLVLDFHMSTTDFYAEELVEESETREARKLEAENILGADVNLPIGHVFPDISKFAVSRHFPFVWFPRKAHAPLGLSGKFFSHSPPGQH